MISLPELAAFGQVVLVDLVLAGDNAIVIAMAVMALPTEFRRRALVLGIAAATVSRIIFAVLTVELLQVVGLVLAGGILLLWVSWKLWRDLRQRKKEDAAAEEVAAMIAEGPANGGTSAPQKTMRSAILQIIVADISMSLDNVLAVAGVAREHAWVLVVGLTLSVAFMGLAAALIARVLARHHWLGFIGLAVIFYVALRMIWDGIQQIATVSV